MLDLLPKGIYKYSWYVCIVGPHSSIDFNLTTMETHVNQVVILEVKIFSKCSIVRPSSRVASQGRLRGPVDVDVGRLYVVVFLRANVSIDSVCLKEINKG